MPRCRSARNIGLRRCEIFACANTKCRLAPTRYVRLRRTLRRLRRRQPLRRFAPAPLTQGSPGRAMLVPAPTPPTSLPLHRGANMPRCRSARNIGLRRCEIFACANTKCRLAPTRYVRLRRTLRRLRRRQPLRRFAPAPLTQGSPGRAMLVPTPTPPASLPLHRGAKAPTSSATPHPALRATFPSRGRLLRRPPSL